MSEVLIAFAAAALAAIALSTEPRLPSEMSASRIAQAAPPVDRRAPPTADDRDDDDDDGPGADDNDRDND
jgi:hypothetical protein